MNVLHVIHGFPPEYMAGSEVYTYNLCKELSNNHKITVFYRITNPFISKYKIQKSKFNDIDVIKINMPIMTHNFKKRYLNPEIDNIFEEILLEISPDIVHVSHLNYLSMTFINILKRNNFPIIYTLHDYWLMCPRGQLITPDFSRCPQIDFKKCGECLSNYFWTTENASKMMAERNEYMKKICKYIDLFIAPSKFLQNKFIEWGLEPDKIIYSDYGFNTKYFENFERKPSDKIRFGYTGRLIPTKGVHLLIEAFNQLKIGNVILKIYGRENDNTKYLKSLIKNNNIEFKGAYNNWEIDKVLSEIDVLIVPSLWYENSPLVIHEAFLAKIPVITSDLGGMRELVQHQKNGLLFETGNVQDLLDKIKIFINNPNLIEKYWNNTPRVKTIQEDASFISSLYEKLKNRS
ncbi:MAG: glycosyltransferase family 4 protein [Candidatus Helarchaeota archaeon]